MNEILLGLYLFFEIVKWCIVIDVVLSWLMVFSISLRPKFLAQITEPLYALVKKILPTVIGPFDFTPIIILLIIFFCESILISLFPAIAKVIQNSFSIL